ncbi:hypothetical protein SAY87_012438 [Trapa incisa]|uniref:Uncharacterized protein n=1 Tax=Trapa incisa TaxID=236973 RepID=A0AAN7GHF8_9MYRT|nr:hypothetical protein SAY87_012438 [Trapa incisa]
MAESLRLAGGNNDQRAVSATRHCERESTSYFCSSADCVSDTGPKPETLHVKNNLLEMIPEKFGPCGNQHGNHETSVGFWYDLRARMLELAARVTQREALLPILKLG